MESSRLSGMEARNFLMVAGLGLSSRASQGNRGLLMATIIGTSSESGRKGIVNSSSSDWLGDDRSRDGLNMATDAGS